MQAAEQDYEKEKLNERIAKLSGGVAVIQVIYLVCAVYQLVQLYYTYGSDILATLEGWSTN